MTPAIQLPSRYLCGNLIVCTLASFCTVQILFEMITCIVPLQKHAAAHIGGNAMAAGQRFRCTAAAAGGAVPQLK